MDAGSRVECSRNINRLQNMPYYCWFLFVCLFVVVVVVVVFGGGERSETVDRI